MTNAPKSCLGDCAPLVYDFFLFVRERLHVSPPKHHALLKQKYYQYTSYLMCLMSPWASFLDILYGDLVYRNVSEQFKSIVNRYTRIRHNIDIMRQTACLIFYTTRVNSYAFLFNCMTIGGVADSLTVPI